MKKYILFLITAFSLASCGVGVYSVSSGKTDEGNISFTDSIERDIVVIVDNTPSEPLKAVKQKDYQKSRNIKKTSNNTLVIKTGSHTIQVYENGKIILEKKIFISAGEHKIIAL